MLFTNFKGSVEVPAHLTVIGYTNPNAFERDQKTYLVWWCENGDDGQIVRMGPRALKNHGISLAH